jgi:ubiquinone/menaquinone biosynthesis C-methylase UbiE
MSWLDRLCRCYQGCFRPGHPEEGRLVELCASGNRDQFCLEYFEHEYRKGARCVEQFLPLASASSEGLALDFGCGAGGLTYRIAERCRHVIGIDLEEYKLEFARKQKERLKRQNVEFLCYDGERLPFEPDTVQSIYCIDVIEHLPTPEHFINEFHRVLQPGGKLFLSFGPPWRHAHGKHMWMKLPGWWTHLLFPRRVVMRVAGFPAATTWEELGIMKLSVSRFQNIMKRSALRREFYFEHINRWIYPLKYIPILREFFIGQVVAVFEKPAESNPLEMQGSSRNLWDRQKLIAASR